MGCNARLNEDGTTSDNLDTLDANALSQVAQGNYVEKLSRDEYIVPSIPSVQRPNLNATTGASDYDSDADGMPDVWESANGFDPNVADNNGDADDDGYTNLEEFLNAVDK